MRYGFTTGSCAAAAAKAAAFMLLSGSKKENIVIKTPKGIDFNAKILDITMEKNRVSCAVVKDGGDDPDVTTGARIYASTALFPSKERCVTIDGGEGVGRVTGPGLDQPIGNAAINSVPRSMIEAQVLEVMELFDYRGGISVIISVPGGEEIAKKTFNPRLGIEGGISIIGTSGIVEPMSMQAIKDTIRVELRQRVALGQKAIAIAPGNYGLDFMKKEYGFDLDRAVKCSNFIGDTIDMAAQLGVQKLLLVGHIGKLIKVCGGIMNTHSAEADSRMELMAASAIEAGCDLDTARNILRSLNTSEGYGYIKAAGIEKAFMENVMDRIHRHLKKRAAGRLEIECIVFSGEDGLLGKTDGAESFLREIEDYR
ncbi:MAG: cobalamin biosynthesis protein CbiD [Butyrivibrio sp.]|nr:cobalamin biosynthesis protein CbiD [Butyrivibrio sp.]